MGTLPGALTHCQEHGKTARNMQTLSGIWTHSQKMYILLGTRTDCQEHGKTVRNMDTLLGTWTHCQEHGQTVRSMDTLSENRYMYYQKHGYKYCKLHGHCQEHGKTVKNMGKLSGTLTYYEKKTDIHYKEYRKIVRNMDILQHCHTSGSYVCTQLVTLTHFQKHVGIVREMCNLSGIHTLFQDHGSTLKEHILIKRGRTTIKKLRNCGGSESDKNWEKTDLLRDSSELKYRAGKW